MIISELINQGSSVLKKNKMPWTVLKEYKRERGMSFYYDIDDCKAYDALILFGVKT